MAPLMPSRDDAAADTVRHEEHLHVHVETVATETVIVQVVAGVLVAAVLVAFGLRFAAVNGTSAFAAIRTGEASRQVAAHCCS